ncbi:MAG TPA: ATP-binding protein [Candidatus Limnocylindrales bacterium]
MATSTPPIAAPSSPPDVRHDRSATSFGRRRSTAPGPRLTLARRFLAANLVILVVAGVVVGVWIGDTLERGIVDRTAAVTALYVESFVEPHLQAASADGSIPAASAEQLDRLLQSGPLGDLVVSLRVWSPSGTIVYGSIGELVGQTFPVEGELAEAFDGRVTAQLSDLTGTENAVERRDWARLLEMYVPVRHGGSDEVASVVEFYLLPDAIDREVWQARMLSWLLVAAAIGVSLLLLYGIVKQGSDTIGRQEAELEGQVRELSSLLAQNEALSDKVRAAAERTTTLNERSLRRISADLHDGPGQTMALALLRLDALRGSAGGHGATAPEVTEVEGALQDALRDMRAIAAGLRMPELASLDAGQVALRAVQDHVRRTGMAVETHIRDDLPTVSLPIRIALYRAIQELLSNAFRHANGVGVRVTVDVADHDLLLDVADAGPGIDAALLQAERGLGLAGMREQAELLGGDFDLMSERGHGTTVSLRWPIHPEQPMIHASTSGDA